MTSPQKAQLPSILVVDDAPANVQLLVKMLTERGCCVHAVLSGVLALEVARAELPDLILLDINMPGMNGFEVCEQLKADEALRDIPVIFLSARDDLGDKVKAFSVGGVDYVTKPFQLNEVYARVDTHLKLRALQRQLSAQNLGLAQLVAQRTQELAKAYGRVQELSRLKDDFLGMISHEMRTPANGVLGLGDLLLRLCPVSDKRTRYAELFAQSSARMVNLLEDASMLSNMSEVALKGSAGIHFPELLVQVRNALTGTLISIEPSEALDAFFMKGYLPLLKKALGTMVLLGIAFSLKKVTAHLTYVVEAHHLCLRLEVDALALSSEQVADYFVMGSHARSASVAESMGLAPVVAYQIITAFGGALRLVKGDGATGYLEAILLRELPTDLRESAVA